LSCEQRRRSCCRRHSADGAITRNTVRTKTSARTSFRNTTPAPTHRTTRRRKRLYTLRILCYTDDSSGPLVRVLFANKDLIWLDSLAVQRLSPVHIAYGAVRRRRTLQMLTMCYLSYNLAVVTAHNCVSELAVRRCTAMQRNMPHKSSRSVCERCCRNQHARLQRRRTQCKRGFKH